MLVKSYEMLSTARVMRARPGATRPRAAAHHSHGPAAQAQHRQFRGGIHDQNVPAARINRRGAYSHRLFLGRCRLFWLAQKQPDDERFLSCSLNLNWPEPGAGGPVSSHRKDASAFVRSLVEIFDHMVVTTRVISALPFGRRRVCRLAYLFKLRWTSKATKTLHDAVRFRVSACGNGLADLFIPRTGVITLVDEASASPRGELFRCNGLPPTGIGGT